MTPFPETARLELYRRICAALSAGGDLTTDDLGFVHASLFPPEPTDLAAFLMDDTNSERDTLLDLIFYPDQALQTCLEPLLEAARFSPTDETRVRQELLSADIDAPVRMPSGRQLVRLRLPEFIKSRYLDRLHIAWQCPPDVLAAIERHVAVSLRPAVKVRLRNTGLRLQGEPAAFLRRFFMGMDDSHPDYLACLELVLTLVDEKHTVHDVFSRLVDYKRACFRSLQHARRFEMLLQRSNMETLMLQGIRAPQESPDDLVRRMTLIDRVCYGVFGRTEIMEPPREEPLREVADANNPSAVFRSLLR